MTMTWEEIRKKAKRVGEFYDPDAFTVSWEKIGENNGVTGLYTGKVTYHTKDEEEKKSPYVLLDGIEFERPPKWKNEQDKENYENANLVGVSVWREKHEELVAGKRYGFDFRGKVVSKKSGNRYNNVKIYLLEEESIGEEDTPLPRPAEGTNENN